MGVFEENLVSRDDVFKAKSKEVWEWETLKEQYFFLSQMVVDIHLAQVILLDYQK